MLQLLIRLFIGDNCILCTAILKNSQCSLSFIAIYITLTSFLFCFTPVYLFVLKTTVFIISINGVLVVKNKFVSETTSNTIMHLILLLLLFVFVLLAFNLFNICHLSCAYFKLIAIYNYLI